jgi:hypothetical protein
MEAIRRAERCVRSRIYSLSAVNTRVAEQFQHQGIADLKQVFEWLSCGLVGFI